MFYNKNKLIVVCILRTNKLSKTTMKNLTIISLFFIIFACQNPPSDINSSSAAIVDSSLIIKKDSIAKPLKATKVLPKYAYTLVDFLRIRDEGSSKNTTILASAREGSYLKLTGKKSPQKEIIKLRDKEYNDYWYQVDLGFTLGWVYGGAIKQTSKNEKASNQAVNII